MQELLKSTTHSIREALFHLSKIIDSGDFHTALRDNVPVRIELQPKIPKCFKVKLSDLAAPMLITLSYTSGSKGRASDGLGPAELAMNQTRRTGSGVGVTGAKGGQTAKKTSESFSQE